MNSTDFNHKLYLPKEAKIKYRSYENEMSFYDAVRNGDLDTVEHEMELFRAETLQGKGQLSDNPIRNLTYHFIISTAMVARFCIDGGLDHDLAYMLSDFYIQEADKCKSIEELKDLQTKMAIDYCKRMKQLSKVDINSKQIVKAIDYIYEHLNSPITVRDIAENIGINETYLSKLFKKETGISISEYIRNYRIEAAKNMLKYSDYSYTDIAKLLCFSSQSHFTKVFKDVTGMTPKVYRDHHFRKTFLGK